MPFSLRMRYLIVNFVVVLAGTVEWFRGDSMLVIAVGMVAFLIAGNFVVYRSGDAERAVRRQAELDYWTDGPTDVQPQANERSARNAGMDDADDAV